MQDQLEFFRVPKADAQNLPYLAARYRELRLRGLELSPASFSSTYDIESRHPIEYWQNAISNPGKELFICAASNTTITSTQTPSSETWIAQVVIRGPIPEASFRLPKEAGQPELRGDEAVQTSNWQFLALYVNPNYRSQGISQRLIAFAIEWLEGNLASIAGKQNVTQLRFRAMVKPDNVPSQQLFLKVGFARAGTCTLEEAHIANGEVDPSRDGGKVLDKSRIRGGHIYILQCQVRRISGE